MIDKQNDFKAFAEEKIAAIYAQNDVDEIYALLCKKNSSFSNYSKEAFEFEFVCLRLAIDCIGWINGCRENHISDKTLQNTFFKSVMDSFASPKLLPLAAGFSDYLYSPDGTRKSDETFSLVVILFKRLEGRQKKSALRTEKSDLTGCVKAMVEITESIRMSFENEFLKCANSSF